MPSIVIRDRGHRVACVGSSITSNTKCILCRGVVQGLKGSRSAFPKDDGFSKKKKYFLSSKALSCVNLPS